jgi:hypothetical protein
MPGSVVSSRRAMVQRRAMGQLGRILLSGSSGSQDERRWRTGFPPGGSVP